MTLTEIAKVFATIAALYPRDTAFAKIPESMQKAWYGMLADIPFDKAIAAVQVHAATSVFPPSISELRAHVADMLHPTVGADEAYELLSGAARKYGTWRAREGLASLPEDVQDAVKACFGSFTAYCSSEEPSGVTRGQFMRVWENRRLRKQKSVVLPPMLHEMVQLSLPEGGLC